MCVAPSDEASLDEPCAEPQSRPSAPRSGGEAQRRALTAVSTRARLSASTAPAYHNILWPTASEKPAHSCARQHRACRYPSGPQMRGQQTDAVCHIQEQTARARRRRSPGQPGHEPSDQRLVNIRRRDALLRVSRQ